MLSIQNVMLIIEKSSEKGTEILASCMFKKGNKSLDNFDFNILVNRQPPNLLSESELKTDEHGFASVRFVTNSDEVIATFIGEDEGFKISRDSKKLIVKEKEKTKDGESFYSDITPDISAKIVGVFKILDDYTADTNEAWGILKQWLDTKSNYQKTWFIKTISKAKSEDIGSFLEQFIYLDDKEKDETKKNQKKDRLAQNFGLLPIMDVFLTFNQYMDSLLENDPESYETIVNLLQKYNGDKVNCFQFHTAHLSQEYFIQVMKNIAASKDPNKAATIRGFFNKQNKK